MAIHQMLNVQFLFILQYMRLMGTHAVKFYTTILITNMYQYCFNLNVFNLIHRA